MATSSTSLNEKVRISKILLRTWEPAEQMEVLIHLSMLYGIAKGMFVVYGSHARRSSFHERGRVVLRLALGKPRGSLLPSHTPVISLDSILALHYYLVLQVTS